jgi:uncharacterized protein (TIGR03435 family)
MNHRVAILIAVPLFGVSGSRAQSPQFEVISIRPVKDCGGGGGRSGDGKNGKSGGPPPPRSSPGRLNECSTVMGFINLAYIVYADGHLHYGQGEAGAVQIGNRILIRAEAGPSLNNSAWLNSDRYMITATAPGNPPLGTILGPMLQALLEDRFKLKLHSETREIPVYAVTVAKGSPRLKPFKDGTCTPLPPVESVRTLALPQLAPGQKFCDDLIRQNGLTLTFDAQRADLAELCTMLSLVLHHPVVDKTGVAGLFDFHFEFASDPTLGMGPPPPPPPGAEPAATPSDPSGAPSILRRSRTSG